MAMYAVTITPLIQQLEDEKIKQIWYADDAIAGGNLSNLKPWWNSLSEIGPDYGYYLNALKTLLIVKEEHLENAKKVFQGTGVSITAEGRRHLGAAIGTQYFVESYVQRKVSGWVEEVERQYTFDAKNMQLRAKWNARATRRRNEANAASELKTTLPIQLQRAMTVSSEKGASSWPTALPINEHGFALHKGAFRDALCLRYGWKPSQLPNQCICGKQFTVEHALNCARGGFPSIHQGHHG